MSLLFNERDVRFFWLLRLPSLVAEPSQRRVPMRGAGDRPNMETVSAHNMENKKQLLRFLSLYNLEGPATAIRPKPRQRVVLVIGEPPQPLRACFGKRGRCLPIGRRSLRFRRVFGGGGRFQREPVARFQPTLLLRLQLGKDLVGQA